MNRKARRLAPGEVALGRSIFGAAIHYPDVRVYRRRYWVLQTRGVAMAPDGNIYFHPADHLCDFSVHGLGSQAWFLHELTHVWQHQQGVKVTLCGMFNRNYRYGALSGGRPFSAYGVEQQACIVADYFRLRNGLPPRESGNSLADYEGVLETTPWHADCRSPAT
ncbi:hypothetical protein BH24PSE2_BH24PSE2_08340 [soil metagenome]